MILLDTSVVVEAMKPATMTIGAGGSGGIDFGALHAGLDLEYSRTAVFFNWSGPVNRLNSLTTAHSTSHSHIAVATKPPSPLYAILLH